jgi:histidinol-phosphate/aromatic aminotransferase/cobyric acid decarboxylase-like protein
MVQFQVIIHFLLFIPLLSMYIIINKPRINQFLRITVGTDEQNQRLVDTLKNDILK